VKTRLRKSTAQALAFLSLVIMAAASPAMAEKSPAATLVDSGSFGVYNSGQRVATETFSIKQGADGSVVSSEFKSDQGARTAEQTSQLDLTTSAELRRYDWKELSPEQNQATVTPGDDFLVEKFTTGPGSKEHSQNFLLPASTAVLDDYFFVQREVLAWKYLAMACRRDKGALQCPMKQPLHFGTLDPHARSSMSVSIEFAGRDKLMYKGAEHEFSRFILSSELGDWSFWLDDQFKLVRLLNDGGTEVLRD